MSPPKHVDLLVLAAAAVVFVIAGFPLLGYAAAAVAWLAQRGVQVLAQRRSNEALKAGNRQRAMGIIGATTLGRVWLMATIVLVVGIVQNDAGLSSAVLLAALFTISMGSSGIAYLLEPQEGHGVQPR
jgi:hypothetical protein